MDIVNGNLFEAMRIILPEHREEMKRAEKTKSARKRPVLSEQELLDMTYTLSDAIHEGNRVKIELFGVYENEVIEGIPIVQNGKVYIEADQGGKVLIPLKNVVSIS